MPGLLGLELYQYVILACLAVSFPVLLAQITPQSLDARPITACVVGLFFAIVLSHLTHFNFPALLATSPEFFKVVLYFLLFLGLVTTPGRLKQMLFWFTLFCTTIAVLTMLQFHGLINLPNLAPLTD